MRDSTNPCSRGCRCKLESGRSGAGSGPSVPGEPLTHSRSRRGLRTPTASASRSRSRYPCGPRSGRCPAGQLHFHQRVASPAWSSSWSSGSWSSWQSSGCDWMRSPGLMSSMGVWPSGVRSESRRRSRGRDRRGVAGPGIRGDSMGSGLGTTTSLASRRGSGHLGGVRPALTGDVQRVLCCRADDVVAQVEQQKRLTSQEHLWSPRLNSSINDRRLPLIEKFKGLRADEDFLVQLVRQRHFFIRDLSSTNAVCTSEGGFSHTRVSGLRNLVGYGNGIQARSSHASPDTQVVPSPDLALLH